MTRIIMHGCNGKMGQVISRIVEDDKDAVIVAGIDVNDNIANPYPVFTDMNSIDVEGDVIIDFSTAKAVPSLIDYAKSKKLPVVLCTTGLNDEQLNIVNEASKEIAILLSANMSLGVNLLLNLVKKAAKTLTAANFDIEIIEKHHNQKIDAPSGTALAFADSINESLNNEYSYTYDRTIVKAKRDSKEIGIHSVRGGTIVGEHSIIFAGKDEVVELNHNALSKDIFGVGAVNAAKFLSQKSKGMYDMQNVIEGN
ncbi:4-hydroxy-tetrahydrodipicolinate reductase [Vallitalea longa]|uniref:4-hydroxy-tetrahydrodipicolinate reductase n=1 Tax=Vallitalea longa TaxID=2936439 RepID=A0A9W5Y8A2_9FIRM|nr:4-hydroxy-tetrahydrodipicolinate reductase [Vallitalea longa]GKX27831.1 4-hydroxy-tetrahydrodipicolinate reductase [Vallitalea longa]